MIARKKKKILIIIPIIILFIMIIGILVALYLTTDFMKSGNVLFTKYISQNFAIIDEIAKKEPTDIKDAIENESIKSNVTAKIEFIDSNNSSNNSINSAQLQINKNIDNKTNYNYQNIQMKYENENVAKIECMKQNDEYGIRFDGIKQFVTGNKDNIDELSTKTGLDKQDLEFITNIFEPVNISQIITFTPSELEIISSTYLSILDQKTNKNQYNKQSGQNVVSNGQTIKANKYTLKLNKEELNNLIITILERIEKDEIILGKIDSVQKVLEKYKAYSIEEKTLRNIFVENIDAKIQDIKNNNIGQEETEIAVYEKNGVTIKTYLKTPTETISIDIANNSNIVIEYANTMDNKTEENILKIKRDVTQTSQNTILEYTKSTDGVEEQQLEIEKVQNKENEKIDNEYKISYKINENTATIKINEYVNIVENFQTQEVFSEENKISLDDLQQEQAEQIVGVLSTVVEDNLKNILDFIKLEDINSMLKDLSILKESELKFEEKEDEEIISDTERNRFNSQLTFFIGKEVNVDTIKQLLETTQDCFMDAQIVYEEKYNSDKKELKGMILDIKRRSTNPGKIEEIKNVLDENKNEKFTIAMSFDEKTKLINKISIVSNKFLE